jgi:hypothetical protein
MGQGFGLVFEVRSEAAGNPKPVSIVPCYWLAFRRHNVLHRSERITDCHRDGPGAVGQKPTGTWRCYLLLGVDIAEPIPAAFICARSSSTLTAHPCSFSSISTPNGCRRVTGSLLRPTQSRRDNALRKRSRLGYRFLCALGSCADERCRSGGFRAGLRDLSRTFCTAYSAFCSDLDIVIE